MHVLAIGCCENATAVETTPDGHGRPRCGRRRNLTQRRRAADSWLPVVLGFSLRVHRDQPSCFNIFFKILFAFINRIIPTTRPKTAEVHSFSGAVPDTVQCVFGWVHLVPLYPGCWWWLIYDWAH